MINKLITRFKTFKRNLNEMVSSPISPEVKLSRLDKEFSRGLPVELREGLTYLITGEKDSIASTVAAEVEHRRAMIASEGSKQVPIWYSPKPGSADGQIEKHLRPSPGKILDFTMERIARTGKNERWGTFLYLLVKQYQCECGIELGSCAGLSALYFSASPLLKKLLTVEGSAPLAAIAADTLRHRKGVTVMNCLFDDAIDRLSSSDSELFDFAYIDGHHEKVATIHYFDRLVPLLKAGAIVIFDDVSWSDDMRQAWHGLSQRPEFSHAVDLGAIGICVMKTLQEQSLSTRAWNLQSLTGKHAIGKPLGWNE
jgi:predicted O-methyltransferase YrrM